MLGDWNKAIPSFVSSRCGNKVRGGTENADKTNDSAGAASLFATGSAFGASSLASLAAETITLPFENGERPLVKYLQKRPMMGLTSRPPQFEAPMSVFNESVITPNDAFFVRYHLASIPLEIDPDQFSVEVKGKVEKPLTLSLADVKKCRRRKSSPSISARGNSRGFFEPRVAGGQLGNGAMGNARWTGVPLKTVLDKAGIQLGAKRGGILESDKLSPAGKRNRIIEGPLPTRFGPDGQRRIPSTA
jgi:sulfite dehydrogenase